MNKLLRLSMQFFAADGGTGGGTVGGSTASLDNGSSNAGTDNSTIDTNSTQTTTGNSSNNSSDDKLEKLIQSKVDRITADLGKKNADLQKKLDKLTKEKLSAEEIQKLEIEEKTKSIAEREKALAEKENKLYAIKAIKEAGLDNGSELALQLTDFVMSDSQENIDAKVKAFDTLVKAFVKAETESIFKRNGRQPNAGSSNSQSNSSNSADNIATKLGKAAATANKASQDVLNHYLGGK